MGQIVVLRSQIAGPSVGVGAGLEVALWSDDAGASAA
jgi:hypothetical protein